MIVLKFWRVEKEVSHRVLLALGAEDALEGNHRLERGDDAFLAVSFREGGNRIGKQRGGGVRIDSFGIGFRGFDEERDRIGGDVFRCGELRSGLRDEFIIGLGEGEDAEQGIA